MAPKILCVAEKPSIAKAVAGHLSGGSYQTVRIAQALLRASSCLPLPKHNIAGLTYQKNYAFTFDFGPPWGNCDVNMTSVSGHLTGLDFHPEFKNWQYPKPDRLFSAATITTISEVRQSCSCGQFTDEGRT